MRNGEGTASSRDGQALNGGDGGQNQMRGSGRVISGALVSTGVCAALTLAGVSAGAGPAAATPGPATGTTTSGSVPVIIFLKRQWPGPGSLIRPDKTTALVQAAQASVRGQLQALGASDVRGYRLVDAIAARVPAADLGKVAASPGVASVIPDSPVTGPTSSAAPASSAGPAGAAAKTTTTKTPPGACSATPQLSPEALSLTHTDSTVKGATTARSLGYTGAGVKVAFLADGIDRSNANLTRGGHPVIIDYKDFSGEGTNAATAGGEAFMDANAIAGQGSAVYNVAGFGAQTPSGPCRIRIQGVAPGASLVALKVFGHADVSTTSGFLQAIDYAVDVEHVNVLDESFAANPFPDVTSLDAVKEFNDMAVAAGTTVVVSAGDAGPFVAIGSPASDPNVISVGASTDFQFYDQTDYAGADKFAPNGWESDSISSLSSGGYTQDGRTLDLVAPGDMSFASCTADAARYSSCVNFLGKPSSVEESGGTSVAAPLVAGAAALVIQAYAKEHHGTRPTPAAVKRILLSTATDLGAPATEQGAGLLNSLKAVELASWMPRDSKGAALELSSNQLNYLGKPGATASWPVTVTNTAKTAQTVTVSGRGFSGGSVVKKASVTLSDAKSPHFTNWSGDASNYATAAFTVPRGTALLNTSIAWPTGKAPANPNARVRVILVDPAGKLAAHSLPQGTSGYGSAQVLRPAAGTWTAVIFSNTAAAGGTAGTVQFVASIASGTGFGTVSPASLTLAPGASAVVHVSAKVPAGAGDSSGSVLFTGSASGAVSVPVTLRGQVPVGIGVTGAFSGTLTGGNGRSPGGGQVAAYSFVVPDGRPAALHDIDVDLALANDPANQVSAYLVAPGGETMGYGSSDLTTGFNSGGVPVESPQRQLSLYASDPVPGTWTLVIDFASPVPGNELSDPFTGRIGFNATSLSRGTLPDSPSASLTRGKAVTYEVTVHNPGAAPEDIFLDPRLTTLRSYTLQPQDRVAGVKVPTPAADNPPEWIVPTMTHSVSVSASSAVPVSFDFGPFPGDPDDASSSGPVARASYPLANPVTPVTQGLWLAVPSQVGPYAAGGAASGTVTSSMTAVTQGFDTSASPANGDFWRFAVSSLAAHASYNLLVVNPGQSRTISLTVTPSAAAGTVVRGMLYIDDFVDSLQFLSGSELAALPYAYTVRSLSGKAVAPGRQCRPGATFGFRQRCPELSARTRSEYSVLTYSCSMVRRRIVTSMARSSSSTSSLYEVPMSVIT
ncbi:MAG TPA: S8 family serine peptidase [Trebonia sp.]